MLTHYYTTPDSVRNIDLTDCNVLREIHLDAEVISHLPPIIRTVTSPQLKEIWFVLLYPLDEEYCDYPDEWELMDTEICALVDRIRPAGREDWNLSLGFAPAPADDAGEVGKSAVQLLPASSQHKYITLFADRTRLS